MITKELAELVAEKVQKELVGTTCRVEEPKKNNGVRKIAITIEKNEDSFGKLIYIDQVKYADIDEIVKKVVFEYTNSDNEDEENLIRAFKAKLDPQFLLENVVFRLVNADMNKAFLENTPHINYLDMAAIYVLPIKANVPENEMSARITDDIVEQYEINEHDLYEAALRNSKNYYDFSIKTINQVVCEMGFPPMPVASWLPLYVCKGVSGLYGATIMLFPECFAELADKYGCDLYIIPSSIHECLTVPEWFADDPEDLRQLCKTANEECVLPEELLGDTIYKYNRFKNEIEITCK